MSRGRGAPAYLAGPRGRGVGRHYAPAAPWPACARVRLRQAASPAERDGELWKWEGHFLSSTVVDACAGVVGEDARSCVGGGVLRGKLRASCMHAVVPSSRVGRLVGAWWVGLGAG